METRGDLQYRQSVKENTGAEVLPVRAESILLGQVERDWRRQGWWRSGEAGWRHGGVGQLVDQRPHTRHGRVGRGQQRELVLVVHPGPVEAGRRELVTGVGDRPQPVRHVAITLLNNQNN